MKPSRKAPDNRHMTPTTIAKAAETTALCCSDPAIGTSCESDAASDTVRVAISNGQTEPVSLAQSRFPDRSWRDDPKIA